MNKNNFYSELSEREMKEYSGGIGPGMIAVGLSGFGVGLVVGFLAVGALYYIAKNT